MSNLPKEIHKTQPKVEFNPEYKLSKREQRKFEKMKKKQEKSSVVFDSSTKEEKVIKKTSFAFYKTMGTICIFIISILILGCLASIYLLVKGFFTDVMMGNIVGGIVTGILVALLGIFVIRPLVIALTSPTFTLDVVDEKDAKKISKRNFKKLQKVAKNIIETNDNVSEDSKNLLRTFINNKKELNATLKTIYKKEISKDIQKTINDTSLKVLISTAISQNNKFDSITVLLLNIRMIMTICVKCGYHPTYARLSKLIVKVFRNALIAYTIQSLNLQDIVVQGIDKLAKGALSIIPGVKEVTQGLIQGSTNALLTLRVGIITRKYLYEEYNIQSEIKDPNEIEVEIVTASLKEADSNIDVIIDDYKKLSQKNTITNK